MAYWKIRLVSILLILVCAVLTYQNWQTLKQNGSYSIKLATFGPVAVVMGVFLFVFPAKGGRPQTATDKILVIAVFVIGLVAGLANWYLMDPGAFGK